jgi:hypothetical protein
MVRWKSLGEANEKPCTRPHCITIISQGGCCRARPPFGVNTEMNANHKDPRHRSRMGIATLTLVFLGLLLWAAHFAGLQAVVATACQHWNSPLLATAGAVAATFAAVVAAATYYLQAAKFACWLGLPVQMARREGLIKAGRIVAIIAMIAMLWTGMGTALGDTCVHPQPAQLLRTR